MHNNWEKEMCRKNQEKPSFSSTLLDEIYRSIDGNDEIYKDLKLQERTQRAYFVEKWVNDKVFTQKRHSSLPQMESDPRFYTSSGTSSAAFSSSSSEADCYSSSRTKSVRKRENRDQNELYLFDDYQSRSEERMIKSESRAFKIYANLNKAKQPISPGGRLSTFLNSLFTKGNGKSGKNSNRNSARGYEEKQSKSTCSSSSRSCLSRTPPSSRNGVKRTVTFNPVGVIVDEDCRPCGHKRIDDHDSNEAELKLYRMMEKNRNFEAAKMGYDTRDYGEHSEEDDAASHSSSDLFEIDHLAFFGDRRFCDELPVYGTTNLHTNRAIASGLVY